MFRIFKRRKDKPSLMYGVFQKVGAWCEAQQKLLCDRLNRKAERFSIKQLKIGLMLFCMGYVICISLVFLQAFSGSDSVIKVQTIRVPVQVIDSLQVLEKSYKH